MAFQSSLCDELMSLHESMLTPRDLLDLPKVLDWGESDNDSFGSDCSSPIQSSCGSLSPANEDITDNLSCGVTGFVFPVKQESGSELALTPPRKTRRSRKIRTEEEILRRKGESKVKRNQRERRRVKRLADGFQKLKKVVPGCEENTKMSKLDTLRGALDYIYELVMLVQADDAKRLYEQQMRQAEFPSSIPSPIQGQTIETGKSEQSNVRSSCRYSSENTNTAPWMHLLQQSGQLPIAPIDFSMVSTGPFGFDQTRTVQPNAFGDGYAMWH